MFTIHAGEYLVGLYVQQRLGLNVWIPAKDTGIDLLVTDHENRRTVSLQAKYGKDFLPGKSAALRDSALAALNRTASALLLKQNDLVTSANF